MEKLTLNQTWTLCLRMWRWIAFEWKEGRSINRLKSQWLRKNGFKASGCEGENCFFCIYNDEIYDCDKCPGVLVDPDFNCGCEDYNWENNPKAFYAELLRLNRIRKAKK